MGPLIAHQIDQGHISLHRSTDSSLQIYSDMDVFYISSPLPKSAKDHRASRQTTNFHHERRVTDSLYLSPGLVWRSPELRHCYDVSRRRTPMVSIRWWYSPTKTVQGYALPSPHSSVRSGKEVVAFARKHLVSEERHRPSVTTGEKPRRRIRRSNTRLIASKIW